MSAKSSPLEQTVTKLLKAEAILAAHGLTDPADKAQAELLLEELKDVRTRVKMLAYRDPKHE
jgi:hypothetical protein